MEGDSVWIMPGQKILYDVSSPRLYMLIIQVRTYYGYTYYSIGCTHYGCTYYGYTYYSIGCTHYGCTYYGCTTYMLTIIQGEFIYDRVDPIPMVT